MILAKFNSSTFATEIVAKGTAKDIADYLSKLAETNESVKPDYVKEKSGVLHRDYMRFDTLIAGINAGQITSFRIDSGEHDGVYSILDPDAPVKPLFSKEETIKSIKGDMYDTYAKKIQERFASLMKDAECLGLSLAYFPTDCDGVHLVAIPENIELAENQPEAIRSIETIDLVKDLPYIDRDKVITLYMGEGGSDRFCHLK
jgi:hypothetical protein